jgi:RNA polymerase sigma-70 factor (ECF subfamily)
MEAPALEMGAGGCTTADEGGLRDLVRRSQAGDRDAFEALYRRCVGAVYALCLRLCRDTAAAEERTQDVFVRAWQRLDSYDGRGSFRGWLRRLAVRTVYDQWRASRRRRRVVELFPEHLSDTAEPEAELGRSSVALPHLDVIDLERAIARLPDGARAVFVLHDVEGYRHTDIAALLAISVGTSKGQLHRARRLLRALLGR